MKKLLFSIVFALITISCATVSIKQDLLAQYYRSVRTKTHMITERFYPDKDYFWVLEEKRNGDKVEVPLVWIDYINTAVGVAFDDLDTDQTYDYCGVMFFQSEDDMNAFLNKFDVSKIYQGRGIQCGEFLSILGQQVERGPVVRQDVTQN